MRALRLKKLAITIGLLLALLLLSGCALTAPRSNAGYANLDSLGLNDTNRIFSLSLGGSLLRFAARHTEDDPELQSLLQGLEGVRVRVYEVDGEVENVVARMNKMGAGLEAGNWQPVMTVQEQGALTQMFMKHSGGQIIGLVVMSLEDDEAVVVNIMGALRPELFSQAMVALEVPGVSSVTVDQGFASID